MATSMRLWPTSTVAAAPAPGSAARASRAASTAWCAARASCLRPTLLVSTASSNFERASACREAGSVSLPSIADSLP